MKIKKLLSNFFLTSTLFLLSGISFVSCSKDRATNSGSLYTPVPSDVTPTATLADLTDGKVLYVNNCGKCHFLYSPDSFTPTNWKTIVPGMAAKSGLSAAQTLLVTKYVTRGK